MSTIEQHPLEPFLPADARLLMLGSFPPQKEKWSMDFFYPNFINDMWRIIGIVFFGDRNHFITSDRKHFDKEMISDFCRQQGIALYDTACEIIRLKDNASDKFLEIVRKTDIPSLLSEIPSCRYIVTTGEKATEVISSVLGCSIPKTGESTSFIFKDRDSARKMRLYRMPSSSRAYPMKIEDKAEIYRRMFTEAGFVGFRV